MEIVEDPELEFELTDCHEDSSVGGWNSFFKMLTPVPVVAPPPPPELVILVLVLPLNPLENLSNREEFSLLLLDVKLVEFDVEKLSWRDKFLWARDALV